MLNKMDKTQKNNDGNTYEVTRESQWEIRMVADRDWK